MDMPYEYSGYLQTLLDEPDATARDGLEHIEVGPDDLARWATRDMDFAKEWVRIPAHRTRTDGGVRLLGRFEDVRQIDNLSRDDSRFWVPMSSLGAEGPPFPIDLDRYPILEVTYRTTSENAQPACVPIYSGGDSFFRMRTSRRWRTVARTIAHNGFPQQLDALIFRLYSPTRTTESFEVASVRFRALSDAERDAIAHDHTILQAETTNRRFPVLEEFLPLGVIMNADTTRRLAETLGLSLREYWMVVLEDLIIHHHNCIALQEVTRLTPDEWSELLEMADASRVKVVAMHDFPLSESDEQQRDYIERHIRPYAHHRGLLAWTIVHGPHDTQLHQALRVKNLIGDADPNHPVALTTASGAYSLYAPHFEVSGLEYFVSHAPWQMGKLVRVHASLAEPQQFWITGPAFVYATATPEWSTCSELRLMVNLAFAAGARGWFSYAYHNDPIWSTGSCNRSLTGPFLAFSDLWLELDKRMNVFAACSPLLLRARPAPLGGDWQLESHVSEDLARLPEGVPPARMLRLSGPDFDLFTIVSNDVLGMTSLNITVPQEEADGRRFFDLNEFIQERKWTPMPVQRHLEMFPGQARFILAAAPEVCEQYQDKIAQRLIDDDLQHLNTNLSLARAYGLDTAEIEMNLREASKSEARLNLELMDRARDHLLDTIYQSPEVAEARSRIIEVRAGLCACDGALCRLLKTGRVDQAHDMGNRVLSLAREATNMRLELRNGRGDLVIQRSGDLIARTLKVLAEIRSFG